MPDSQHRQEMRPLTDITVYLRDMGYDFLAYPPAWDQKNELGASYKGHPNFQMKVMVDGGRTYRVWGFGMNPFSFKVYWHPARGIISVEDEAKPVPKQKARA